MLLAGFYRAVGKLIRLRALPHVACLLPGLFAGLLAGVAAGGCAINGGLAQAGTTASVVRAGERSDSLAGRLPGGPSGAGPSAGRPVATGAIAGGLVAGGTAGQGIAATGAMGRTQGRPTKVALLVPLSAPGPTAMIAKALKQAGELALFELDNAQFQLIVKDDKGTPEGAVAAAESAIKDGAELIIGPLTSQSVRAVGPVARAASIPVVGFSNDRDAAGSGVYVMGFMPDQEIERVIAFAASRGRRNFAALLPDDEFGKLTETVFSRAVLQARGNLIGIERYQGIGTGLLEPTQRLVEALRRVDDPSGNATAVLVPGGPELLGRFGPMLNYAKLDTKTIKLIGDGGWDVPGIGRQSALLGAWFAAADQKGWRAFAEKYTKTFGTLPPRIASLAFDAVGIAITLSAYRPGERFTRANLTRAAGFNGVDGLLQFAPDGTPQRALAVNEVEAFGATMIDPPMPAPPSSVAEAGMQATALGGVAPAAIR